MCGFLQALLTFSLGITLLPFCSNGYIEVLVSFAADGNINPLSLKWEDGTDYIIEKFLNIRSAAALKADGQGDRYTICVAGRKKYLFFERNAGNNGNNIGRWFVERKQSPQCVHHAV